VGIQEVRWDIGDTIKDGDYICFCGRGNKNHQPGTEFFVHHRTVSAVMTVEFDSNRMSYIVLRGPWCNIIVLNVHSQSEEKLMIQKTVYMSKCVFLIIFHTKILLGDFNAKTGQRGYFQTNWG
jgi:hypothetical protein